MGGILAATPPATGGATEGGGARAVEPGAGQPWYVLWTRSHCEQLVHDQLAARDIEVFLPKAEVWSRRQRLRQRCRIPLFPGYLFCRLRPQNRLPVLKNKVRHWLMQREDVLAFCQARTVDGGAGAVIVLLKSSSR